MKTLQLLLSLCLCLSFLSCKDEEVIEDMTTSLEAFESIFMLLEQDCTNPGGLTFTGVSQLVVGCPDDGNKYFEEFIPESEFRGDRITLDDMNRFSSTTFQDFTSYNASFEDNQLTISWTRVGLATFESCDLVYVPE